MAGFEVTFRAQCDYSAGSMSVNPPASPRDLTTDEVRPSADGNVDSPESSALDNERQPAGPGASDPDPTPEQCLNCGAELTGRYCAQCGQDAHHQVLSLRHAVGELIEDISQADARVWRTLQLLALRPGELTCEYLRGKRASHTPPLRLYVALSLLLFLVALLPEATDTTPPSIVRDGKAVTLTQQATAALDEALSEVDEDYRAPVRAQVISAVAEVPAEQQVRAVQELADACGKSPLGVTVLGAGITAALPHDKLVDNCKKVDGTGRKLWDDATEYLPKMMVFFLPLIALFGKLLYLGSRRYYIGHLIFFVHFHAFVFLAMATGNLAGSLAHLSAVSWLEEVSDLITFGLVIWVPIYLYKAMRRVYGQARWVTRTKFVLLGAGYLINFVVSLVLLIGLAALQSRMEGADWKEAVRSTGVTIKTD
jgi:hypothetical protein